MDNEHRYQSVSRRRVLLGCSTGLATITIAGCTEESGSDEENTSGEETNANNYRLQATVIGHGQAIEEATVSVNGENNQTDENGSVTFENLSEGNYEVEVEASGWQNQSKNVSIPVDGLPMKIVSFDLEASE